MPPLLPFASTVEGANDGNDWKVITSAQRIASTAGMAPRVRKARSRRRDRQDIGDPPRNATEAQSIRRREDTEAAPSLAAREALAFRGESDCLFYLLFRIRCPGIAGPVLSLPPRDASSARATMHRRSNCSYSPGGNKSRPRLSQLFSTTANPSGEKGGLERGARSATHLEDGAKCGHSSAITCRNRPRYFGGRFLPDSGSGRSVRTDRRPGSAAWGIAVAGISVSRP